MKQKTKAILGILTALTALICLTLKVLCAVIWPRTEPRNDLPLICVSLAYFLSLGVLCFLSGHTPLSTVIVGAVPGFDVLITLIAILTDFPRFLLPLHCWTGGSSYATFALVNHFEDVGQCLSDWYYFVSFAAANLLVMGMIFLGRRHFAKRKG